MDTPTVTKKTDLLATSKLEDDTAAKFERDIKIIEKEIEEDTIKIRENFERETIRIGKAQEAVELAHEEKQSQTK